MIRRTVNLIAARHIQELFRRVILARWELEAIECIEQDEHARWWIYLRAGYANSVTGAHVFNEATHRDAVNALRRSVVPCGCAECEAKQAKAWSMDGAR